MNYLMTIFWFIVVIIPSLYASEVRHSSSGLCESPVVFNSIDIFPNGSIRIYKDKNWWQWSGLPDRTDSKTHKFERKGTIDLENMTEVNVNDSISTVLEGPLKGRTYKFRNNRVWSWSESGRQESGGSDGEDMTGFPKTGFTVVFHDGHKIRPKFVALTDNTIHHIYTDKTVLGITNFPEETAYRQHFPQDIDAAFVVIKSDNQTDLYSFKYDKYCIESYTLEMIQSNCTEWRENAELFGCLSGKELKPNAGIVTIYSSILFFVILVLHQIFNF